MRVPDWGTFALKEGVLRESVAENHRIILWMPGGRDRTYRYWERVVSVSGAEVIAEEGVAPPRPLRSG